PFLVVWRREKDKYILYAGDFKIIKDPRFRIEENMTALIIDNIHKDDASEYTCQVGTVPPKEITHTLTVTEM
ncbi:limbic system-associated membrane protein precursor-like protein, partial [Leptotrombidium deliense]